MERKNFRKLLKGTVELTKQWVHLGIISEWFVIPDLPLRRVSNVFIPLWRSAEKNGNHGRHGQAESEARLILGCSIFPDSSIGMFVAVVILAVTVTPTLTFRERMPPPRPPSHANSSSQLSLILKISA